jgi:hypothetical protein
MLCVICLQIYVVHTYMHAVVHTYMHALKSSMCTYSFALCAYIQEQRFHSVSCRSWHAYIHVYTHACRLIVHTFSCAVATTHKLTKKKKKKTHTHKTHRSQVVSPQAAASRDISAPISPASNRPQLLWGSPQQQSNVTTNAAVASWRPLAAATGILTSSNADMRNVCTQTCVLMCCLSGVCAYADA